MTLISGAALQQAMLESDGEDEDEQSEETISDQPTPLETVRETEERLEGVDRVRASDGVEGTIVARVPSYGGLPLEWEYDLDIDSTTIYHIEWDDGVRSERSALVADDLKVVS